MKRAIIVIGLMTLGLTAAIAQSNVVEQRQDLMKQFGAQSKTIAGMLRGQTPFDLAQAQAALKTVSETAKKLPPLFPESTKDCGKNRGAADSVGEQGRVREALRLPRFGLAEGSGQCHGRGLLQSSGAECPAELRDMPQDLPQELIGGALIAGGIAPPVITLRGAGMRKALLSLVGLLLLGAAGFYALTSPTVYRWIRSDSETVRVPAGLSQSRRQLRQRQDLVLRWRLRILPCGSRADDKLRLGGGLALATPFGTFHVPNISPHKQDGIGAWRVKDFVRAMREGIGPGETHLYPAFPYASYQRMSPADLTDLHAFIMTLPPVEGRVRDHELKFPFTVRRGIGLWDLAFLDGKLFMPDPSKSASWNRGAYLVNGPGHCAECHSERNFAGAIIPDRRLRAAPTRKGKGVVPNITPSPSGIGGWTEEEVVTLLKTGDTPNFDTVGGPMADVVRNTAQLSEADRAAMAEYILSLPPLDAYKKP